MTTLVIEQITTSVEQEFNLNLHKRYHIGAFIPYIYMHNSPAATFTFSILSGATVLFSKEFTSTDIKISLSTTNNYAHVFYPIVPSVPFMIEEGSYIAKITSSAIEEGKFLGWIKQHEDLNNTLDYTSTSDDQNPLAMRLKIFKEGIL